MCLPVNQMFVLHVYENQPAFQDTLLTDKSIKSKHRWPGWPLLVFLVGLTPFKVFSMTISVVTCKKTSSSSAATTASRMCSDRWCTDILWYQVIRGCIQSPPLCQAFQNKETPHTRTLSFFCIYSLVKSKVYKNTSSYTPFCPLFYVLG